MRSNAPVNHSGLQRGSLPSKCKRSNADEHARKRLKDTEIGEEQEEQKMKGGRGGKKAKGMKKKKNPRYVPTPSYLQYCTSKFYRKTSMDKAQEEAVAKEATKAYK